MNYRWALASAGGSRCAAVDEPRRTYLLGAGVELSQPLFIIEKSTNANVVHYDAVIIPDGGLNPQQPIIAYWVMAAEDGRREDLTSAERRKAFGSTIVHGRMLIHILCVWSHSNNEISMSAETVTPSTPRLIAGRCAYLTNIYVKVHKVPALPRIEFIELFGSDIATGEPVCERVRF
jgi:hypothetical protein